MSRIGVRKLYLRNRIISKMSGATPLVADNPLDEVSVLVTPRRTMNLYSVYVLFILLITYLLNQLDRYILGIVTKPMAQELHYGDMACMKNDSFEFGEHQVQCNSTAQLVCEAIEVNGTQGGCKWDFNGQGIEYEILAGPIFIVVYTVVGIPLGLLADFYNRRALLAVCLALWSAMTLATGFVQQYWQLALTRFILGIGQAGCTPFATSLIAEYFAVNHRAFAISFYNWGIYIGYSMSYAIGNYITISLGWRWTWIICGIPGLVVALIILLTVKEPHRQLNELSPQSHINSNPLEGSWRQKTSSICRTFLQPSLLVLCFAGSVRNAAGYVWAYNTQIYYQDMGATPQTIAKYMSSIPLTAGCVGVVLGGFIADRVVKRLGVYARLFVLVISQLVAAPFVAGALFLDIPFAFISLIPGYIFGEMWVGITLAVVVEVVPTALRTSAVAVYMFIISNVGGNMPLLVPVLKSAFHNIGYSDVSSLRGALYILYPGLYVAGALLFMLAIIALRWDLRRHQTDGYRPIPTASD